MHVGGLARERGATLGERERALEVQRLRLCARRGKIRLRRLGRVSAVEMLGAQRRIALAIPPGGCAVQLGAARPGQRGIDAVADQRVGEQELLAVGTDERSAQQRRAGIVGNGDQVAHERQAESAGRRPPPPVARRVRARAGGRPARARGSRATPAGDPRSPPPFARAVRETADCRRRARCTSGPGAPTSRPTRPRARRRRPPTSGARSSVASGAPASEARKPRGERIAIDARGQHEQRAHRRRRAR